MNPVPPSPWSVDAEAFPPWSSPDERLRFLVRYAVLAPSGHNTQPWRFHIEGDMLELWADRTRALPVVDPQGRELTISCGAALYHLRLAAHHYGYAGEVERLPDPETPDLLARFRLGMPMRPEPVEEMLFEAIPRRRTNRRAFEDRFIPWYLLHQLEQAAGAEGAWLDVVTGPERKDALADLVEEGDRIQMADPAFREEHAAWMRPADDPHHDGLSAYALGAPKALDFVTPVLAAAVRRFDRGEAVAAKDRDRVAGASAVAVLGTPFDDPAAWLRAGEALAHLLLRATAAGVSASFLNQPVEVPALRPRLAAAIGCTGHPQLLFRLGFGPSVEPSARRMPAEVMG